MRARVTSALRRGTASHGVRVGVRGRARVRARARARARGRGRVRVKVRVRVRVRVKVGAQVVHLEAWHEVVQRGGDALTQLLVGRVGRQPL